MITNKPLFSLQSCAIPRLIKLGPEILSMNMGTFQTESSAAKAPCMNLFFPKESARQLTAVALEMMHRGLTPTLEFESGDNGCVVAKIIFFLKRCTPQLITNLDPEGTLLDRIPLTMRQTAVITKIGADFSQTNARWFVEKFQTAGLFWVLIFEDTGPQSFTLGIRMERISVSQALLILWRLNG